MASRCGKHIELTLNPHARVTRCACGVVHLHFVRTGVTLQLPMEAFRATSAALMGALDKIEGTDGDDDEAEPIVN